MTAPAFLETAPATLLAALVSEYETALGRELYPAQLERLLLQVQAYRESLVRLSIQDAAEQCLVQYSSGSRLECLGALVGVSRLPASKAATPLRLTLPAVSAQDTAFAAGWGAIGPGNQVFRLAASAVIPAGQLSVNALAEAETAGSAANGIAAGGGWTALEGSVTVTSTTASSGGADIEDDEALRARIMDAPARFSAAGSAAAYRYHALSASSDITAVAVDSPSPGVVGVYVLTADGLPAQATLDRVTAALGADTVRPICDLVQVQAPTRVSWILDATLTLYRQTDASQVLASAQAAVDAYAADRRAGLGRDLVGSQIIKALSVDGVYKVTLNGWTDRACAPSEWADAGAMTLHIAPERADG